MDVEAIGGSKVDEMTQQVPRTRKQPRNFQNTQRGDHAADDDGNIKGADAELEGNSGAEVEALAAEDMERDSTWMSLTNSITEVARNSDRKCNDDSNPNPITRNYFGW